jgi:hypothetical protein
MSSTGMRLGGKYSFGEGKVKPWAGLAFGFYQWRVNYFNAEKDQTYGNDTGYATGLTYLAGADIDLMEDMTISIFADLASPVAEYTIEGLFYDQWDISDYQAHIMGPYRIGLIIIF